MTPVFKTTAILFAQQLERLGRIFKTKIITIGTYIIIHAHSKTFINCYTLSYLLNTP
jgi:hypothetical protein